MSYNNRGRKLSGCTCYVCGKFFEKPLTEINRNIRMNRNNFCNKKCLGVFNAKNFGDRKNNYDITKHSNNAKDGYTGIRALFRRIKQRHHDYDVDLEYLKELWDNDNSCVYTGVKLVLPKHTGFNDPLYTASLDRIESSKGYVKGNVQYISITANHAKNSMSHEQMINFCNLIVENKKPII
jgi:hypothetical protein